MCVYIRGRIWVWPWVYIDFRLQLLPPGTSDCALEDSPEWFHIPSVLVVSPSTPFRSIYAQCFRSGYGYWLAPVAAILCVDYL